MSQFGQVFGRSGQEESRSISENVTWGQRKRMADGKIGLPYGQLLGYEKGEDGLPKIVESAVSQEDWNERNSSYIKRYSKATERIVELEKLRCERQNKAMMLDTFIKGIDVCPPVSEELDDKLWAVAVEKAMTDGELVFSFKDGTD